MNDIQRGVNTLKEPVYELRGIIYSQFASEAKCADTLMWPRQKLNKITTGKKMPDIVELSALATVLGKTLQELADIFVAQKVNKWMTDDVKRPPDNRVS